MFVPAMAEDVPTRRLQANNSIQNKFRKKRDEAEMTIQSCSYKRHTRMELLIKAVLLLSLFLIPAASYALGTGDKAPDFHAVTIKGKALSYNSDFKGKKPVYLIFWTTW